MNEKDLINLYKKQLSQSQEKAPDGLWSDIERKMDIEEVWDNISERLEADRKRKFYWLLPAQAAGIAGIIVLTGLAISELQIFNRSEQMIAGGSNEIHVGPNDTIQPITEAMPYSGFALAEPSTAVEPDNQADNDIAHSNLLAAEIDAHIAATDPAEIIRETEIGPLLSHIPASVYTAAENIIIAGVDDNQVDDFAPLLLDSEIGQTAANNFFIPKPYGLSLGITSALKNTWLMNTETALALEGHNGSRTELNFFSDFSLSLRYDISSRWGVKGNLSLSSNTGQSYQQFIYGRFSHRDIELNYMHIDLAATHRHRNTSLIGPLQFGHRTSLGMYFASLNHAHETIAGIKQDVTLHYRNSDYGIVAGHELDIFLHPRFAISPGLFVNWGLPNIYAGQHNIISPVNRTSNFSFDFRVAVYYNFIVQ